MTVKELKRMLENVDDNAIVVVRNNWAQAVIFWSPCVSTSGYCLHNDKRSCQSRTMTFLQFSNCFFGRPSNRGPAFFIVARRKIYENPILYKQQRSYCIRP